MLCLRSSLDYSQVRPDFRFPAAAASLSPFPFAILPVTCGQLKARVSTELFYASVPVHPSDSPSAVYHPKLKDEGSLGPPYLRVCHVSDWVSGFLQPCPIPISTARAVVGTSSGQGMVIS